MTFSPLLPVDRLLARLRGPREDSPGTREADLRALRARFTAQPHRWTATREQRALAERLVELKRALSAAFEGVTSCASCARGEPLPKGRWDGECQLIMSALGCTWMQPLRK